MEYISLLVSFLSIGISIFTFWKTLFDERLNYDIDVVSVVSPENLVSPKAGILYLELVITNKSSLPLVIVSSRMELNRTGMINKELSESAYFIDTLISTHTESSGKNITRQIEQKSNGLPISIKGREAAHFIIAYPAPGILGIDKSNTNLTIYFSTNREEVIVLTNSELNEKMTTLEKFLIGRVRIA